MTPREVFARMRESWLDPSGSMGTLLADDGVVEGPFAPPGRPKRWNGRAEFVQFAEPARAAFPIRFEEIRELAVHDTTDPGTIVVEYEMSGVNTNTGTRGSAQFIGVLTVRDDQIVLWREYQDTMAIMAATA